MNKPLRNPEIVWRVEKKRQEQALNALESDQEIDDSGTVILLQSGMMHQLNLVGGLIWQQCDGINTIDLIAASLAQEFSVTEQEVKADVVEFVADLSKRGWLING